MSNKNESRAQALSGQAKVFTFNASNQNIRVQMKDGEPWFVAKDVCDALEIENNRNATARLDDDEKGVSIVRTSSGDQQMTIVNESGLYNLIFQSRKPEAKAFRKWVTSEVLPTLRKTGRYELKPQGRGIRRMSRGEGVNAELLDLLWLIGESLDYGDQQAIALELGVSRVAVNRTLNGYNRSSRILMALYRKAKENRERKQLYHQPGTMAAALRGLGMRAKLGKEGV
ncbi:BRO family protein [uncultured Alloprevotella sp.]|uniref:BRO-N domain-containing protein n=1 Tax=uncultured Alloprevotella sp. TaxID=1283315 RepID=UPI00260F1423|nr:BRO family protein [uncultured Alloprevotella sp.]